jgi:L-threonylcarbamoyladenylate synthase
MSDEPYLSHRIVSWEAPEAIAQAGDRIAEGGVVAIPTDTVYGICASLAHPDAIERLYQIKRRDARLTIPILVSSIDSLRHVTSPTGLDRRIELMLERFWPGALTFALESRGGVPALVVAGDQTVGARLPNHPLAIEVISRAGGAVACTSANISGQSECRTALEVARSIGHDLDLIVDGGQTPGGRASTVVRLNAEGPVILRQGPISEAEILKEWKSLDSI